MNQVKTLAKDILASPAILIFLFFALACVVAVELPSRFVDAADGIPTKFKPLVSKVSAFLSSSEQPDLIILGSSLVLMPAVRCDDRLAGKNDCFDDWYYYKHIPEYSDAKYLEHYLQLKTGIKLKVRNLGVASSIMSDHAALFENLLSHGKKPSLLICGIAPRDFLDNSQQKYLTTPTQQFLSELNANPGFLPEGIAYSDFQNCYVHNEHQIKKVVTRLRDSLSGFVCELSHHPAKLQFTKTKETAYMDGRPNLLKDLQTYKRLYNPPNYDLLEKQKACLTKMLHTAKEHGVEVVLVNMPLTKANTDALEPKAHAMYLQTIRQVAQANDVRLLDIGSASKQYELTDFEDCCHLNACGGTKFFDSLLSLLGSDQKLIDYLAANQAKAQAAIANNSKQTF